MALPVVIEEFFYLMQGLWSTFPVMVRQIFYVSFVILGLLGIMKFFR